MKVSEIPAREVTMMPPSSTPTVGEARAREQGHGYGLRPYGSRANLQAA